MSALDPPQDFASDRAIGGRLYDKLDRKTIARKLADGIARRQGRESFVVALQGAWGSGKTSVKNMMLEALEEDRYDGKPAPIIVEFEPWQLRDSSALFAWFFSEISVAVGKSGATAKEAKRHLDAYSKALEIGGSTVEILGRLGGLAGTPLSKQVENAGKEMKNASKALKSGADGTSTPSLQQAKRSLKAHLTGLKTPILVIIDDIDRLEIDEMLLVFQLVKANADFPNFTYLLLLQRETVEEALTDRLGKSARGYLEKIIQLPIDVPLANATQRKQLLFKELRELLRSWGLGLSDTQVADLELLWNAGLGALTKHPRDVIRLLNALEFSIAVMKGDAGLEINLADFIALESLRIQESRAYAKLPNVKIWLTRPRPRSRKEMALSIGLAANATDGSEQPPGEAEMREITDALSDENGEAARAVLKFVFPAASWAFETDDENQLVWSKQRPDLRVRASGSGYFERYFALAIPDNQISEAQIQAVIAAAPDAGALLSHLTSFVQRGLLSDILWELQSRTEDIPAENYVSFFAGILDFCDVQPSLVNSLYYPATEALSNVLAKFPSPTERGDLLEKVLRTSNSMGIASRCILDEERAANGEAVSVLVSNRKWATPEQFEELKKFIVQRISDNARKKEFLDSDRLIICAALWFQSSPDDAGRWIKEQVANDDQLRTFLTRFRSLSYIIGGPSTPSDVSFAREIFDWLDDVASVRDRVERLDKSDWSPLDSATAQRFVGQAESWIERQNALASSLDSATTEPAAPDAAPATPGPAAEA